MAAHGLRPDDMLQLRALFLSRLLDCRHCLGYKHIRCSLGRNFSSIRDQPCRPPQYLQLFLQKPCKSRESARSLSASSHLGPMVNYDEYLRVALIAAKEAGAVIKENFFKDKHVELKGAVDLVTETDKKCEELVLSRIHKSFPDHKFIGEEGSAAQGFTDGLTAEPTWMCDPVDGTTNFVHSFPFVCVCIGLAIDKEVVVGVVYNPIMEEMFTAVRGKGAFLNGSPIHASACSSLGSALAISEIGVTRDDETLDALFGRISALTKQVRAVRAMGSCALDMCCVACGRAEISYEIGFGGPWDVAAASLIVEEAGGKVLDPAGGLFNVMGRRVLATNSHLAEAASSILSGMKLGPHEPRPAQ